MHIDFGSGGNLNMPALHLTKDHVAVLSEYLRNTISDLSVEIAGTDRHDYREEIKAERRLLQEVMHQLDELAGED